MPDNIYLQMSPDEIYSYFSKKFQSNPSYARNDLNSIDYLLNEACDKFYQFILELANDLNNLVSHPNVLIRLKSFYEDNIFLFDYFNVFQDVLEELNGVGLEHEISDSEFSKTRVKIQDNVTKTLALREVIEKQLEEINAIVKDIFLDLSGQQPSQKNYGLDWLFNLFGSFDAMESIPKNYDYFPIDQITYQKFSYALVALQKNILAELCNDSGLLYFFESTYSILLNLIVNDDSFSSSQINSNNKQNLNKLMHQTYEEGRHSSHLIKKMIIFLENIEKFALNPSQILKLFLETFPVRDWQNKQELLVKFKQEINNFAFTGGNLKHIQAGTIQNINKRIASLNDFIAILEQIAELDEKLQDNHSNALDSFYNNLKTTLGLPAGDEGLSDRQLLSAGILPLIAKLVVEQAFEQNTTQYTLAN